MTTAEDEQATQAATEEPSKQGRGKRLILVGLIIALLAAAAAAFLLLSSDKSAEGDTTDSAVAAEEPSPEPFYLDMKKLLVNVEYKGRMHYVQAELQLMSYHQEVIQQAIRDRPAIRDRLIILFNGQDFGALKTPEGKEALRSAALISVNKTLGLTPPAVVEQVYFENFVLQ
ncbi:MAG: flagellar basal body-associated FliL family protein [Pseudomonadota bacterium]